MTNINKLKSLVPALAAASDMPFSENDWSINYKSDLDRQLDEDLVAFQKEIELLAAAMAASDLVTAACALVVVRMHALHLSNFFMNIFEDIEKVGWSEGAKIPEIPDDYEVPDFYDYKNS
ncbi:hypothetical protein [Bordetella sp. LUAb4]|uniref:hypothetical protein n=1 Tax=Bordetella sp. LUAb4 TaxID=2843195 RepID=UPI001E2F2D14|nr:hypothetical protein [Bordetella sp. LUAb4]